MIPLKLALENFKCYRADVPTLHLQGVHVACLCGGNGHGKSSLLDAITWALWGDAVHRPQDELIHIGEQNMRVELEFIAGGPSSGPAQGQRYRVIRRYARGRGARAGATSLELQIAVSGASPEEGEFRSISGNSVRETETQIVKLVGMDYTTFVNSAFLVQGRADEFTTKRPAERQQVLARVLGLELYDRLQERARLTAREVASEMQRLQGQVHAWSQQLEQRPEHEAELPSVEAALQRSEGELAEAEKESVAIREQVGLLRERQRELDDLRRQANAAQVELGQLRQQKAQHERRVQLWESVAERERDIAQRYAQYVDLRQRDESLNTLVEPYSRLQAQKEPLDRRVQALPSLETALAQTQSELGGFQVREQRLDTKRSELQSLELRQHALGSDNQRLRAEMEALRGKVDMLSEGDATCPLCGTVLGVEGREHIQREYESQGKTLANQFHQNQATLKEIAPQHSEIASWLQQEERSVAEGSRQLHGRIGTLTQQVEEARRAPDELEAIQQRLDALGYDAAAHRSLKQALLELGDAENQHRQLQEAIQGLPEEREGLTRVSDMIQRREEAIRLADARIEDTAQQVVALPELEQRLREMESRASVAWEQHQQLVARRGFLLERLREYEETEKQKAEAEATLQSLAEERQVFDDLATAFGRTGVQALIIEAAIPELESHANDLLGRMTDNTMHLRLETQRETQRGGSVETLEIKVADVLGTRSYETFSGGEAFRINLALRIALSKLLAHRSGAPLPTLFIDEGFGTQDAPGRERVLDVIQAISEDFECILVITHMDEVKNAFPVRIEVEKIATGSTFAIT